MGNDLYGQALWEQVTKVTKSALARGTLKTIPTHCEERQFLCGDTAIHCQVRVVDNLTRKSEDMEKQIKQIPNPKDFNPFLPYETSLYVGELTKNYRCLLNKFNIMDHHILMVTTDFVPQQAPLDLNDFLAAQICLQAHDGLVFYNGGIKAGASVVHKHLQMIPLPLATPSSSTPFPFFDLFANVDITEKTTLPFPHRVTLTNYAPSATKNMFLELAENNCQSYYRLLNDLNVTPQADGLMPPHNMLMTRDYLWVIPRSQESHRGLAVNALGFTGSLLLKNKTQLKQFDEIGYLELLKAVAL
jgi:sulfate adenylyltransferase (ADP) / ATP adenylyltransferase